MNQVWGDYCYESSVGRLLLRIKCGETTVTIQVWGDYCYDSSAGRLLL
jgi:hypothetical protein